LLQKIESKLGTTLRNDVRFANYTLQYKQIFICSGCRPEKYNYLEFYKDKECIDLVNEIYAEDFVRFKEHYTFVYYGASISALTELANLKGYSLVFGNSNGNNAFFVRNDLLGDLKVLTPKEAYVKANFRDSRDLEGNLDYLSFEDRVKLIENLEVFDINKQTIEKLKDAK